MKATLPTDFMLRATGPERLCELFHENSKLTSHTAVTFMPGAVKPSTFERYLMTRGFRQFPTGRRIALTDARQSAARFKTVLRRRRTRRELGGALELADVGSLLIQALGCTAVVEEGEDGLIHALRAWPSAGGLYPLDVYVLASAVADLEPGAYHFNPITSELEGLGSRPVGDIVGEAFFGQAFARDAALHVVLAATFERTLCKYGERGYRLLLLDAGHAAQNLLLAAEMLELNAAAMGGFCDDSLNRDLGLDGISEAVVHTLLFGRAS
ncbi:MAG: hypothetical protein QOK17_467 [Sphingomonadales bacterium]|jgi:SagB-type dehydrogenase family enzyme|nr:hypothetical protein [Sphingomonadales bacterium]